MQSAGSIPGRGTKTSHAVGCDPKVKKVVRNGQSYAYIAQSITLGPNVN